MRYVKAFFAFVDAHLIVRRIMLGIVTGMFVDSDVWAKGFALHPGMTGIELAAVMTAVLLPATGLQAAVFKMYGDTRKEDGAA